MSSIANTNPSSNQFTFVIEDIPERVTVATKNEIRPNILGQHTNTYRLLGKSTADTLTNKTITDPSNNIAAKSLIVDNTILPLGGTIPTVGQVPSWNGSAIVFQDASPIEPSSSTTQLIYVRKGGSDAGTGGITSPYATIQHAFNQTGDASTNKRYMIDVGPGNWAENLAWPCWVFVRGNFILATRFTGTHTILHPSWQIPGPTFDQRGGAQNINFSGTFTLDYAAALSQYGKFYFFSCNVNNTLNVTGLNAINQLIIEDGLAFGGITAQSCNIVWQGVSGQGGSIVLNSSPNACSFSGYGGGIIGSLTVNHTGDTAPQALLLDCPIVTSVTINGPGAQVIATNSSLPARASISILGGGTLTRLTDAFSTAYIPTPSNWITQPNNLADAIDQIASVRPLLTGTATLAAGSVVVPALIPAGAKVTVHVQPGPVPTGQIYCSTIVPNTSFTIASTAADNCNVFWQIFP